MLNCITSWGQDIVLVELREVVGLPVARTRNLAEKDPAMDGKKARTILCPDDHLVGLATCKALLEEAGYRVYAASSGNEALRMFATEHIDLVITEYWLPDIPEVRIAMLMKLMSPDIPVLILSELAEDHEFMGFADALVSKKETPSALLATVAKLLGIKAASASAGTSTERGLNYARRK